MRFKYAFLLLTFCVIILSCTDKKPVSQALGASVPQEDSVPVKKVDSVKVAKTQPLTYKITILFVNQLPVNLGKVKTADVEISDTTFLAPGTTSRFAFAGKRYELVAKAQGEDVYKNYTLLLNGERICREAEVDGAYFRLLFAGDLDGDGKLDLVLSLPLHYENLRVVLFLSSCAPPGLQIGKAAEIVDDFSC